MNVRQIEVFHAIMKTGSISGAAGLLRVSQPAVSQVLLHTEDQLRFPLFHRVKGRLQETPQARVLFRETEVIYEGLQRVKSVAASLRGQASGTIQILASPGPGYSILPEALKRFRASHPQAKITLDLLSYGPMVEMMKTQQADLAVALCPSEEPTLATTPLCQSRLFCLLPAGHPLCSHTTIFPAHLSDEPVIAFAGASAVGKVIMDTFHDHHCEPNVSVSVPFGTNTYNLVVAGIGIAIVDGFSAAGAKAFGLATRPFGGENLLNVVLLQNRERPATGHIERFIAHLRDSVPSCGGFIHSTN